MHNDKCQPELTVIFYFNQIGAEYGFNWPGYQYVPGG